MVTPATVTYTVTVAESERYRFFRDRERRLKNGVSASCCAQTTFAERKVPPNPLQRG